MKNLDYAALFLIFALVGCGFLKTVAKTADNIADDHCQMYAANHAEELASLTPEEWCGIRDNVKPFLDILLASQQQMELSGHPGLSGSSDAGVADAEDGD